MERVEYNLIVGLCITNSNTRVGCGRDTHISVFMDTQLVMGSIVADMRLGLWITDSNTAESGFIDM